MTTAAYKLPVMIDIIDNNDVINEFYNLIEHDLLGEAGEFITKEEFKSKAQG